MQMALSSCGMSEWLPKSEVSQLESIPSTSARLTGVPRFWQSQVITAECCVTAPALARCCSSCMDMKMPCRQLCLTLAGSLWYQLLLTARFVCGVDRIKEGYQCIHMDARGWSNIQHVLYLFWAASCCVLVHFARSFLLQHIVKRYFASCHICSWLQFISGNYVIIQSGTGLGQALLLASPLLLPRRPPICG